MDGLGDVLTIARRARGLTRPELAELVGVTQPAIIRYESGVVDPDESTLAELAGALGVTEEFLTPGNRFRGALAVGEHMRRRRTSTAAAWRQMEARLNLVRVHASFLFEEVSIASEQQVPVFDPEFTTPEVAAAMVRTQWRLPMGPVRYLTRWLEAAGCLVFEEDFGIERIDGLSQWVDDHPIVLVNANATAHRKRLTKAHELGHLVLHSNTPTEQLEEEADRFAAEFLMPADEIGPEFDGIDLGMLPELERDWGVPMSALLERAYRLGQITLAERVELTASVNAPGWLISEPDVEVAAAEKPTLPVRIGKILRTQGFSEEQAARIAGYANPSENPFRPEVSHLRVV